MIATSIHDRLPNPTTLKLWAAHANHLTPPDVKGNNLLGAIGKALKMTPVSPEPSYNPSSDKPSLSTTPPPGTDIESDAAN